MRGPRCGVSGCSPSRILGNLIFAVAILLDFSESASLKGKQLVLWGRTDKYVFLAGHHIPELCMFTACVDLNKTEGSVASGTAFSYDVDSSSVDIKDVELALSVHNSTLQIFLLGRVIEVGEDFPAYKMHQVCLVWDGQNGLLELFHNGHKWAEESLQGIDRRCLRPNGTLVMGHLHKNQGGHLALQSSFVGILHYFQMWDNVRGQQQIQSCDVGNTVSWRDDYWSLNNVTTESAHYQRCGAEEPTSVSPTLSSPEPILTVTFYKIQMNFSVTYEPPKTCDYYDAKTLSKNWFKKKLNNSEFEVTNYNVRTNAGYSSKCIIKATSDKATEETMSKLQMTLCGDYTEDQLSMSVTLKDTNVTCFDPEVCPAETIQSSHKGAYRWPETIPPHVMDLPCETNRELVATRSCLINIQTEKAYWRKQNLRACPLQRSLPDKIVDLENVTVTEENAEDVADHILSLLGSADLSKEEIAVLTGKLTDIANCEEISMELARKALEIINIFMGNKINLQNAQPELNRILSLMEQIGFKMNFYGRNESIVLPRLALAVVRPDPMNFHGVAFGITYYNQGTNPQFSIRQTPFMNAQTSIFLPGFLRNYLGDLPFDSEDFTGIQFSFFGVPSLFEDNSFQNEVLNSYVVGASIENKTIQNLEEPVTVVLQHRSPEDNPVRHCVFWDFNRNHGLGGWNTSGCEIKHKDVNYTICSCNHLTHFGILLDLSWTPLDEEDEWNLTLVTYVGCGISSIFLGLALLVYLSIDKVRGDHPSKILINLCVALLMLNLTFLVDSWLAMFQKRGLCVTAAVMLHYFLLAAFTWMGLEAVNMYYSLVKVLNAYIPNYILKLSIAGWGIPALMVTVVLAISRDFYGTKFASRSMDGPPILFCWIEDNWVFYTSVVGYFILVFLINVSMFVTVLRQVQLMKANSPGQRKSWSQDVLHDLKRVVSLMTLLGLTWGFAFFSWGPMRTAGLYIFAISNSLQGFFIFVFHCLMKENVRKQCQVHFCCGKFRISYFRHVVCCRTSHTSSTFQTIKLPHVRRTSPVNVELHFR